MISKDTKVMSAVFAVAIITVVILLILPKTFPETLVGGIADTFGATGTTNGTSTVNTTSTQVLPGTWRNYARISLPTGGASALSCYLDGATAASSSVATNAGIIIPAQGITTSTGPSYVEFGRCENCVPYIGIVNCIAPAAVTVGRVFN